MKEGDEMTVVWKKINREKMGNVDKEKDPPEDQKWEVKSVALSQVVAAAVAASQFNQFETVYANKNEYSPISGRPV